jgi:hypothetical protein
MVGVQVIETLQWCLEFFVKRDEMNAAVHTTSARYSPLTFSVAETLHTFMEYQPPHHWPSGTQELVERVLSSTAVPGSAPPM